MGSLRRSVGQHRGQIEREVESLSANFEDALTTLKSEQAAAQQAIREQQAAAMSEVATLGSEVTRLREEMTTLLGSARALENNHQATFNASQTANQEAFSKLLTESREAFAAASATMQAELEAAVSSVEAGFATRLEAATEQKARIDGLFEIAAETTLIGSYTRNATRERKAADVWRLVAIGAALIAVAIGIWATVVAAGDETDWDLLAAKAFLGLIVAGVAAYAATQSAEHRSTQRDAEHVAVQLAALKPYLADLSQDTERDRLLVAIAEKLFGQSRVPPDNGDLSKLVADNPSLLGALLTAAQAASK